MSEGERPFVEEVLDYAFYAPLGVAMTVVEDLPGLVEKGRSKLAGQIGVAKFVGRMAAKQAKRRLDGLLAPDERQAWSEPERPPTEIVTPRADAASAEFVDTVAHEGPPVELPIPGYDTLPASQVVARLAGLSAEELESVRLHETAHRARRTILARITQLEETRPNG